MENILTFFSKTDLLTEGIKAKLSRWLEFAQSPELKLERIRGSLQKKGEQDVQLNLLLVRYVYEMKVIDMLKLMSQATRVASSIPSYLTRRPTDDEVQSLKKYASITYPAKPAASDKEYIEAFRIFGDSRLLPNNPDTEEMKDAILKSKVKPTSKPASSVPYVKQVKSIGKSAYDIRSLQQLKQFGYCGVNKEFIDATKTLFPERDNKCEEIFEKWDVSRLVAMATYDQANELLVSIYRPNTNRVGKLNQLIETMITSAVARNKKVFAQQKEVTVSSKQTIIGLLQKAAKETGDSEKKTDIAVVVYAACVASLCQDLEGIATTGKRHEYIMIALPRVCLILSKLPSLFRREKAEFAKVITELSKLPDDLFNPVFIPPEIA